MRFLKVFSLLTVLAVFFYLIAFAADESIYGDVVRLHVIANSDTEADQNLKLEVRDFVLAKHGEALAAYKTKEEALCAAEAMLGSIEAVLDFTELFLHSKA